MAYEQKFTEDEKPYELDEEFVMQLRSISRKQLVRVLNLLHDNAQYFTGKMDDYMEVGGVLKGKEPFYFKVGYVYSYSSLPVLVNFEERSSDEYLDFILDDSYLIDLN